MQHVLPLPDAQADHPNCSRDRDVTRDIVSGIIIYCIRKARSWLDISDQEKCFIKHRNLHLSTPNMNVRQER